MRILVVSDLHANSAALEAIQERFDVCLCLGDLVEYGPDPIPCINWARKHAAVTVRGNHDHGTAQNVTTLGVSGFRYLTMATRRYTTALIDSDDRRYLATLPTSHMTTLDGKRFFLVHASPRDPMDEYVPPTVEAWQQRLSEVRVDFLLVGHTHIPYTLQIDERTTVVNPGSVGLQRDGNPKMSYAIIENGVVELKRVEYDIEKTVAAVGRSHIDPVAKQMLIDIYRNGKYIHPPDLPRPIPVHQAKSNGNGHHHTNGSHAAANGTVEAEANNGHVEAEPNSLLMETPNGREDRVDR